VPPPPRRNRRRKRIQTWQSSPPGPPESIPLSAFTHHTHHPSLTTHTYPLIIHQCHTYSFPSWLTLAPSFLNSFPLWTQNVTRQPDTCRNWTRGGQIFLLRPPFTCLARLFFIPFFWSLKSEKPLWYEIFANITFFKFQLLDWSGGFIDFFICIPIRCALNPPPLTSRLLKPVITAYCTVRLFNTRQVPSPP
jgi:hypothetical protein